MPMVLSKLPDTPETLVREELGEYTDPKYWAKLFTIDWKLKKKLLPTDMLPGIRLLQFFSWMKLDSYLGSR